VHITGLCVLDKEKLENGEELAAKRIGYCGAKRKTSPHVDRKL